MYQWKGGDNSETHWGTSTAGNALMCETTPTKANNCIYSGQNVYTTFNLLIWVYFQDWATAFCNTSPL